jgi:serine O-acetyltransferase
MMEKTWQEILTEARQEKDPDLSPYLDKRILQHKDMPHALSAQLARKISCIEERLPDLRPIMLEVFSDKQTSAAVNADLRAVYDRDSACTSLLMPFLYYKGFAALQTYRVAHHLWKSGRKLLALLIQSLCSEAFGIDIHPATQIGQGVMMDHGSAIVIGETAVVGDNVSIMQGVTLGGTGKEEGQRHPKVESGVLISAGAIILGNIRIGTGAKIGAGSVVLRDVEPHTTVAGVPAEPVGSTKSPTPALDMDHDL